MIMMVKIFISVSYNILTSLTSYNLQMVFLYKVLFFKLNLANKRRHITKPKICFMMIHHW
jgi:hypothetical protein